MFNSRHNENNDRSHLHEEDFFGKTVRECYDNGIELFNWHEGLIPFWGNQPRLFYVPAINQNEGIWFISYSNLNQKNRRDPNHSFNNIFSEGYDRIEERYAHLDRMNDCHIGQIRVTFVKNDYGQYLFLGVYKAESIEGHSVFYRRIYNTYPYN